jgi:hypothetical protein
VADAGLIEAVLFVKPEAAALADGVDVEAVLKLIGDQVADWKLSVDAISVLGARYLEQHNIIARHYGVINQISRNGADAISDDAKAKLEELFGEELRAGARVVGGHQFLATYPQFTPWALDVLVTNLGAKKLAPGTNSAQARVGDATLLVLNGFHPYQLEHFTSPGRAIITMAVRGAGDWKALRNEFCGATNPAAAAAGSLRRTILDRRQELGIKQIDQGNNAVHFSAGPLEGMVETMRYFTDYSAENALTPSDTCFGRLLLGSGFDQQQLAHLAGNPTLQSNGRRVSAFDLTEEKNPAEALELLKAA